MEIIVHRTLILLAKRKLSVKQIVMPASDKDVRSFRKIVKGVSIIVGIWLVCYISIMCSQIFYHRAWTQKERVQRRKDFFLTVLSKEHPQIVREFEQSAEYKKFISAENIDSVDYYYRSYFDSTFRIALRKAGG